MIRLAWRQFRSQAALALVALAALAVVVAVTGANLAHLYDTTVAPCNAGGGDCQAVGVSLLSTDLSLQLVLSAIVLAAPALVGIFWGAPLIARELETGTFRLAWTQSITRTRWLAVKLGVVGLSGMAIVGLLSLMVTWWYGPIDRVSMNEFQPGVFDARDIVPIAYAAFAIALGITAGLVIRRTTAAMAATMVGYVGALLVVTSLAGPYLMPPAHANVPLSSASDLGFDPGPTLVAGAPDIPNAWVLSSQIVDGSDQAPSQTAMAQFIQTACPKVFGSASQVGGQLKGPADATAFHDCIVQLSSKYHEDVTYQPADRYWVFQWCESAIFLGLAVILAGVSFWWIRRRV
jgi:hypothetical protein